MDGSQKANGGTSPGFQRSGSDGDDEDVHEQEIERRIELALEIVERKTGIGRDMILGRSRSRDIADARFMVCWIAKFQGMGLVSIARELQRTHGAIANGIEQINAIRR